MKLIILIYEIDDYVRKLFFKECFTDQDHFSGQDPDEFIPIEYLERRNHNIKFSALTIAKKLMSDTLRYKYII